MRAYLLLSMLASACAVLAMQACGGSSGTAAASADAAPSGDASGDARPVTDSASYSPPEGTCGWVGIEGLDASCSVESDCPSGQICLVAEGCFCTSVGRCIDQPCDGGLSSPACASSVCVQALSGNADPEAGVIDCFVSGC